MYYIIYFTFTLYTCWYTIEIWTLYFHVIILAIYKILHLHQVGVEVEDFWVLIFQNFEVQQCELNLFI